MERKHRHDHAFDADKDVERERDLAPSWPGKRTRTSAMPVDPRTPDLKRIRAAIGALRSDGKPLPGAMTREYSQLLGLDLSGVRIHQGGAASAAAKSLEATAFTHGTDIAVAESLDLDSAFGRHVLAHELVHVAQNLRSGSPMELAAHAEVGPSGSAVEQEAERGAAALTRGMSFQVSAHGRLPAISRYSNDENPPTGAAVPVPVPGTNPPPVDIRPAPTPQTNDQPQTTPAPAPNPQATPAPQPRPNDQPSATTTPNAPATPQPGTPGYSQPSGSAPATNPTTLPNRESRTPATPIPQPAPTPALSLEARVQQELEQRADPTLKAGYAKAVAGVDSLRIQALQFSFTPNGVWNTLVETFTAKNAFQDHFGQIYSTNAYRGGNSWADTAQAWIEGLRGVIHIIGDVASVISAWAGLAALVTGALALILSETVIGGIALGAIAAIAAEVALVAGAIKLLTDIIDTLLGIIQMIILIVRARNSKDPAARARFAQLLHKEANDFGANVVSIGVQVAVMAVSAGIGAGLSRGANSFMSAFKNEFSKMITPALKPWTLGNNFRSIANMARPVVPGRGVSTNGRTVLNVEVSQNLIGIQRLQRNALGRVTSTREVVAFTTANQMRGARLVTMRAAVGRAMAINGAGVKIGLGSAQLQADIKQPRDFTRGGTASSAPSGGGGRIDVASQAGADLTKLQMWPSQIEAFENAKGPIQGAVDRTQRQYEMAEAQAGPELAAQVRTAFQGANNNAGQMRFGAMQVQTDATAGQANTQRGLQQTQQARQGQERMGAQQNAANTSVQKINGEGAKLQSPPPKEGVLGWLYNQTIGRIGAWIGSAQKWVMNLVGKWAMSLAGFSKEEMDIAGIENDMREDDKKDETSSREAQDAAIKSDQIQQTVFQLQENKTRDEQYAIQGMADAQRFIQALEDADRQLAAAIQNGQSYVQQVTPILQHELQTEDTNSAIDAAYVAPVNAYAQAFADSLDSSNIGSRAGQQGNDELNNMKAAYPELDIGPGQTVIAGAVSQYESAFGTLAGQARTQAAAMQTAINAFIGTQDYDGVGANARALDALAADFDRQAQALADQLYDGINSVISQYNAHIQRAIDEANQVPDETGATIPPQAPASVSPTPVPQAAPTTSSTPQPTGTPTPASSTQDQPAPATPAPTPQPTGDADTPATNPTSATATRAAQVAARPGNNEGATTANQQQDASLNANQAAAAQTGDQPAATQTTATTPAAPTPAPQETPAATPQPQPTGATPRSNRDRPDAATQSAPAAVQRKAEAASTAAAPVEVATRATDGAGSSLPFLDTIQASFGHHDVSQVRAHDGDSARAGAAELGARAFAVGDAVAFAATPDLHTAAHEAAHVVQQRSGRTPDGGIDTPGDALERQADAVADAVVAGRSAESMLDQLAGGGASTIGVQREADDDKDKEQESDATTAEARIKTLTEKLEKTFTRNPGEARQAATTLSLEFPTLYTTDWLLGILKQIDDAELKRRKMKVAEAKWDRRPSVAEDALRDLMKAFPKDARLVKWCRAFIERIQIFQLTLRVKNWDRPSEAKQAAEQLHGLKPKVYTRVWRDKIITGVDKYQDAAWAQRVSEEELRTWIGANDFQWDEAPPEVKQELQILLGRMKRDQAFTKNGGGAKNAKTLSGPTSEQQRLSVLDAADNKSADFNFETQDIPARKLEVTASRIDKEAEKNDGLIQPINKQDGFNLFAERPDVMTELFNKTFAQRSEDLRQSSAAYRALAQRLRNKETSLEAERALMQRDKDALGRAINQQNGVIEELDKSDPDNAAKLRKTVEALQANYNAIEKVLADPTGVAPNAGSIASMKDEQGRFVFPQPPEPKAFVPASKETQEVGKITNAIDRITGQETGFEGGVGQRVNEMLVGLVRLSGRVQAVNAGVQRMFVDVASYVLPESWTTAMRDVADTTARTAAALKKAQSNVTAENDFGRRMRGDDMPLIDRVLSTEKIFEAPDVAIFSVLSAIPTTKGAALIAQVGIGGIQTFEAFFSTYGQGGTLKESLGAAGWSALQNAAGIALGQLGFGAAADTAANVALTYGFGKLRGLSNAQIEEEIAFTLIGSGIGAATGAARRPIEGLRSQVSEVRLAMEGTTAKTDAVTERVIEKPVVDDTRSQKIDVAATELRDAMIASRELTRALLEAQSTKQPTNKIVEQLRASNTSTKVKKAELKKLFAEETGTTKQAVTDSTTSPTAKTQPVPSPTTEKVTTTAKVEPTTNPDAALEARLIERDGRFRELFAVTKPADSMSPELLLKGLERQATAARAKYPELAKLSDAELMAVIGYTTSDSVEINQGLRGELSAGKVNDAKLYAEVVTDALAKLPDQAGTFTRMVNYDAAILAQFVEGGFVREPGFSSTSRLTSQELAAQSITGNTEVVINGKRGKQIDFLSKKGAEGEVLFAPDTTFRVDSVVKNGATTKIVLTEVESASGPVQVIGKPRAASDDVDAARKWASELANSKPEKMTDQEIQADLAGYMQRKETVQALYEKAMADPSMPLPAGVSREQLKLAVEGDADGQRIPLTFNVKGGKLGTDVVEARQLFDQFQGELKAVLASEGITDAVVVQLGSGTTGWSTSPGTYKKNGTDTPKVGKPWSPTSDTDFAIFSDQALVQAQRAGVVVNPKNNQNGQYTTLKNSSDAATGAKGFIETPLGKKLDALSKKWNEIIYGTPDIDGFDFKINLQTDKPFQSAVPIVGDNKKGATMRPPDPDDQD